MKFLAFVVILSLQCIHAAFLVPLHAQRHPTILGYQIGDENMQNIVEDFKMPTKASDTSPYTYFPVYSKPEKSKGDTKSMNENMPQIMKKWSKEVPLKLVPKRRGDKDTTIPVNSQVKLADPTGWSKEVPLKLVPKRRGDKDTTIPVNSQVKLADPNVPHTLLLNSIDEKDHSGGVINPLYFADEVDDQTGSNVVKSPRSMPVNNYLDSLSRNEMKYVSTPVTHYLDSLSSSSESKIEIQPFEAPKTNIIEDILQLQTDADDGSVDAAVDINDASDTNNVLDSDMQNIPSYTVKAYEYISDIGKQFDVLHAKREFLQNSLVRVSFEIQKNAENALSFAMLKLNEVSEEHDLLRKSITVLAAVGDLIENTAKKLSSMSEEVPTKD